MSARRRGVPLRTLILGILAAVVLLASAILGQITYSGVYALILRGFEGRLVAASTVTAAFIDAADHERLLRPRRIVGLTAVPGRPYLLGLDAAAGELVAIDTVQGGARTLAVVRTGRPGARRVHGLVRRDGRFLSFEPGRAWLAWDTASGSTVPAAPPLPILAPARMELEPALAGALDLAVPEPGVPVYVLRDDGTIHLLDPATGRFRPLATAPVADTLPAPTALALGVDGVLYAARGGLVVLDPADGRVRRSDFVSGFRSEGQPTYQKYVRPMRRLARRADLTYLYTQVVEPTGHITYVLDATEGDDHTPIGTPDELPASELEGTVRVLTQGRVYVSGIQHWEQWGLLKTSFAPIVDAQGRRVAMAGADVDISIISRKTRVVLARVALLAVLTLLLGSLVSYRLARGLAGPISAVREAALHLAAGARDVHVSLPRLREARDLTDAFNAMSVRLLSRIENLRAQETSLERFRAIREIDARFAGQSSEAADGGLECTRDASLDLASGCAPLGGPMRGAVAVWLADPTGEPLDDLRTRATVAGLALALGEDLAAGVAPADLPGPDAALDRLRVHTLALIRRDGTVRLARTRPGCVVRVTATGNEEEDPPPAFTLADGERLVLRAPAQEEDPVFRAVFSHGEEARA